MQSGSAVLVETDHDGNWELGRTPAEVTEGHDGSHGSVDQADVHPQVAHEHHAGGGSEADDRFESSCIVGRSFGRVCAGVDGLDGGDRLPAGSELGDVVLDDGFGGGVEVEGVGEGGQVSNARWCLHHEVVPVCQGHLGVPEAQQDVAELNLLGVLSGLAHDTIQDEGRVELLVGVFALVGQLRAGVRRVEG